MAAAKRIGVWAWTLLAVVLLGAASYATPARAAGTLAIERIEPPAAGATGTPPTTGPLPTISGTTSEPGQVHVQIFEGESPGPPPARVTLEATPTAEGHWQVLVPSSEALSGGERYTAVAEQAEGAMTSSPVVFAVSASPPNVTLTKPAPRVGKASPVFSGAGSENGTEVVVHVLNENKEQIDSGTTTVSAGTWSAPLQGALPEGAYTVYATEASALGNDEGRSATDGFEVDTGVPIVTLEKPPARTRETMPVLTGAGSEDGTEVIVHVLQGTTQVREGSTKVVAGRWSARVQNPLPDGSYEVYATESSGLGNGSGTSETRSFEVVTHPPTVTLVEPPKRSNLTRPSFSGTGSEEGTEVVVHVLDAASKQIAMATTTVEAGGSWAAVLENPLPKGELHYTVYATEASGVTGDPAGESHRYQSELDTEPPKVELFALPTRSRALSPTFSGTGSEEGTEVLVHVLDTHGTEIDKGATTVGAGGKWTSTLERALSAGNYSYTVYATEVSGLKGNGAGQSAHLSTELDTKPPTVTLMLPAARSNDTLPVYSGTGTEEGTEVIVNVYGEGHELLGTGKGTVGAGGKWSATLKAPLPDGEYRATVVASEISGLGNQPGESAPAPTEIDTQAPNLTLDPLPLVSSNTTPTFSGTSNEGNQVSVRVYQGSGTGGTLLTTLVAQVHGHAYKVTASSALKGTLTAVATQPSGLEGNPRATTGPVNFEIDTEAPVVDITPPPAESHNLTPSFSGTVQAPESDQKEVRVELHEGSSYLGPVVRSMPAKVVAGHWETVLVSPALPPGRHAFTAVASTESALGNQEGRSAPVTFVVNTEVPSVVLDQPASPTRETTPTFAGTASEEGEVIVHVLEGATQVAETAGHTSRGLWSAKLKNPLPEGEHRLSVYATEASGLGNGEGESSSWAFTLDTRPPTVLVTQAPLGSSSERRPSFIGTASDSTEVTVEIHRGADGEGPVVASLAAKVENGEWFVQQQEPLEFGEYTALAIQPSSIGNAPGESAPMRFVVAKIPPVAVTEAALGIAESHAALYGSVNPQGGPVSSCTFEIGTSTGYGKQVACGFVAGLSAFPSGATGAVPVFVRVYGLRSNTIYHYRVAATGEGGTSVGPDQAFTTLPEEVSGAAVKAPPPVVVASGSGNVLALMAERLLPSGSAARIGALLHNGGYRLRFRSPEAGMLAVAWYRLPPRPHGAHKPSHVPAIVVASGHLLAHGPGTFTLKITLTVAGRHLLNRSHRIALSETTVFTPPGGKPVKSSGPFELKR